MDKLEDPDDENFDYDIFGEGTKMIKVAMMPPLPRDEMQDSAGDSDDSDSLLGNVGKLSRQLLQSNAELLLHKEELDEAEEETLDEGEEENEEGGMETEETEEGMEVTAETEDADKTEDTAETEENNDWEDSLDTVQEGPVGTLH